MFKRLLLLTLSLGLLTGCRPVAEPPGPPPINSQGEGPNRPADLPPDFVQNWGSWGNELLPGDVSGNLALRAPYCPTELAAPYDAARLSVGLYWYAPGLPGALGGVGCRARADGHKIDGYYDPARPVLIFVHGWQPGITAQGLLPGTSLSTRRENFWFGAGGLNVADFWIRSGWNVGFFQWTQLADEEHDFGRPYTAQAKIWTGDYALRDGTPIGMRWNTGTGYEQTGPRESAGELFYSAYRSALKGWTYRGNEPVRVMGHSLGAQMALSLARQAYRDPGLPAAQLPRRLILADPYWTGSARGNHTFDYLAPDRSPAERSNRIVEEVTRRGAVVEWYESTPLLSLGGDKNSALMHHISRVLLSPDYLSAGGLQLSRLGSKHMVAPRWYLWSLIDAPADSFGAARSLTEAGALMQQRGLFDQRGGKLTPSPADDTFVGGVDW